MSLVNLEKAYIAKDLSRFEKELEKLPLEAINYEYKTPTYMEGFNRGTALTSTMLDGIFTGDHRFVEALLKAGANPNIFNKRVGTSTIGALFHPHVSATLREASESVTSNLDKIMELLMDHGARFEKFVILFRDSIGSQSIMRILKDRLAIHKSLARLDKRDFELLKSLLCEDLDKQNNMREIKTMAKALGILDWKRKSKTELCRLIGTNMSRRISKSKEEKLRQESLARSLEKTIKTLEKADLVLLKDLLCEDLSHENRVEELRAMARVLGVWATKRMRKSELCSALADALLTDIKDQGEIWDDLAAIHL